MFADKFCSSDLQCGFKKKIGYVDTLFALRQTIEYFNRRDNNEYIASLDASKAFDRVNHYKRYSSLIKKGLPIFLLI